MIHQRTANPVPPWGHKYSSYLVVQECDESDHSLLLLEDPRLGDREEFVGDVPSFSVKHLGRPERMRDLRGVVPDADQLDEVVWVILTNH